MKTVTNDTSLMALRALPEEVQELVHYSTKAMGRYQNMPELHRFVGVVIRDEANAVLDKYNKLAEDKDQEAFETWVEQRKPQSCWTARGMYAYPRVRNKALTSMLCCQWVGELTKFLDALEAKKEDEKELLRTRRVQIKERLLALGWESGDLKIHPRCEVVMEWDDLLEMPEQPKPLTDRIWKNLYPKLKPLLETNREDRLERARLKRAVRRRHCLAPSPQSNHVSPTL
ncbi:hypothetical protein FRC11_003831 [Ceratobasidium sp. 423]|nr:hypothetical protein FRC11_003831 [Ceratobasidium sp. 423]